MSEERRHTAAQDVIYLASCAVNKRIPSRSRIGSMDMNAVFAVAANHMISSAIAFALESAGIKDKRSGEAIAAAQRKAIIFRNALTKVKKGLEAEGIWYLPLKGIVLIDLYPGFGMREFADHDILFDAGRADDVKAVMEGLGFRTEDFGSHSHDAYFMEPDLNFEMHRELFSRKFNEQLFDYYEGIQEKLLGDGLEKHFCPEDFYLYLIAHEYKHYCIGGTGLRSLLDTYVYLQKNDLDMSYVTAEVEKMGIAEFEAAIRSLAQRLFTGRELTEPGREMLDYILSSGSYGTFVHTIENRMAERGWGRLRYALNRFFVPVSRKNKAYETYAAGYPLFYKHKILLPLLPFYRTFRAIKSGKLKHEAETIMKSRVLKKRRG